MSEAYKDKEKLRQLYIEEDLSYSEIAEEMGLSGASSTQYWCNKFNLNKDRSQYLKKDPDVKKDKLRKLYWGEKLSQSKIADKLGYEQTTIGNWLREYGIETRGAGGVQEPDFDKKEFEKLYVENGLGLRPISDKLDVSRNTLKRWRNRWGIEPHNPGNTNRTHKIDSKIIKYYVEDGLSQAEIAEKLDIEVHQSTISKWLNDLKVNTKNKAGWGQLVETNRGETVKSILEKRTADWLHKNNIDYKYEPRLSETSYVPDFKVGDILIEAWGVTQSDDYDKRRREKIKTYESIGFDVVSIFPKVSDRQGVDEALSDVAWTNSRTMKN